MRNCNLQHPMLHGAHLAGTGKRCLLEKLNARTYELSLHSVNFRTKHRIHHPPTIPIPGDISGPPLNDHMGSTFTWISKFWLITHEIFGEGYNSFSRLPMSHAHQMYQLLLDWAAALPDDVKRSNDCPHHVLVLQ